MKPVVYDFPQRAVGAAAVREASKLRRSMARAAKRGDVAAVQYLSRRLERLLQAYRESS